MGKHYIVFLRPPIHHAATQLVEREAEVRIVDVLDPAESVGHALDCDGVIIRFPARIDRSFIEACRNLKAISICGAGIDHVDIVAASEHGIPVTYVPDANPLSVAEHTVALVMALAKHLGFYDRQVRQNNWKVRDSTINTELRDKTIGIIGMGRAGTIVAQICGAGLGMRPITYRYRGIAAERVAELERGGVMFQETMEEVLAESDFVCVMVPMRPSTKHLIGARELALMKPTAFLVNTARGPIVDTEALVRALTAGKIAGAGLDTVEPEPLPQGHPLLGFENVIFTPHNAGMTHEAMYRLGATAAEQLLQMLRGDKPTNLLNPSAWPGRIARPILG